MTTPAPGTAPGTGTTTATLGDAAEVLGEVRPKRLPAYPTYRDGSVRWLATSPEYFDIREVES